MYKCLCWWSESLLSPLLTLNPDVLFITPTIWNAVKLQWCCCRHNICHVWPTMQRKKKNQTKTKKNNNRKNKKFVEEHESFQLIWNQLSLPKEKQCKLKHWKLVSAALKKSMWFCFALKDWSLQTWQSERQVLYVLLRRTRQKLSEHPVSALWSMTQFLNTDWTWEDWKTQRVRQRERERAVTGWSAERKSRKKECEGVKTTDLCTTKPNY